MFNHSVTEFQFLGLANDFKIQVLLFVILTLVYIFTVLGNVSITFLILADPCLQTPMYFFLSNLSCVDLLCSTTVTPKMLATIFAVRKTITFPGCAVQFFFFALFAASAVCLLGVMAYDRYVAICKPLHYHVIISQKTCVHLVIATHTASLVNAAGETYLTFSLPFCGPNIIESFFCDFQPMVKLSCSDTSTNQKVLFVGVSLFAVGSLTMIMISYGFIVATILRIPSISGRFNAFSTCASHFTGVLLYYGTVFVMYFQPVSSSMTENKVLSLVYTAVIPMLNPIIYSFRNKDVKRSLEKSVTDCVRRWMRFLVDLHALKSRKQNR